jgi:hypothetical protein
MSWTRSGDLICNCCGKIVIQKDEVNEKDLKENTGRTICMDCWKTANKYGAETD